MPRLHLCFHCCSNRAYYAASTLGGLSGADQRITEDVEKFAYAASELYSHTFKVGRPYIRHMVPKYSCWQAHMHACLHAFALPLINASASLHACLQPCWLIYTPRLRLHMHQYPKHALTHRFLPFLILLPCTIVFPYNACWM